MQDAIAVHWEVAAPREPHGRCAQQWEEIRAYHKRTGYSDIAYSFGACQHGQIFVGRGWGTRSAATCNNHWNGRAWSVCWMGGPGFTPSNEALRAIRSVVDEARSRGATQVIGHREACATQCPGDFLMDWINRGLPVSGTPAPSPQPTPGPQPPPIAFESGDLGMDGIYHDNMTHFFYIRPDGRFCENYGKPDGARKINDSIFPAGWAFATDDKARVKVQDHAPGTDYAGYSVAALRDDGKHVNVAVWHGDKGWKIQGAP